MNLLTDDTLERSHVVANCRMNRERNLIGSNGYSKEIGFNPLEFVRERVTEGRKAAWLDLCCGTGNALIEAARIIQDDGLAEKIEILGVDLVGMFHAPHQDQSHLRLVEASLSSWWPTGSFDLITCVHGLHYVGDTEAGLFIANLDLTNVKLADRSAAGRRVTYQLRRAGLEHDRRRRLVICRGQRSIELPFRYIGADDRSGLNYTRQPAVNSYYEETQARPSASSATRVNHARTQVRPGDD
jgi:SAM-dependent methyltransferase